MSYVLRRILDFIYPRTCSVCGQRLTVSEDYICAVCDWRLPRTYFADNPEDNPLVRVVMGRYTLVRAASWLYYRSHNDISRLVQKAKYSGRSDICRWLGSAAASEFQEKGFFEGIDVIVPVPLTLQRRIKRGYNQSREIARGISSVTGIKVVSNAVRRKHFRTSQTHLNALQRMDNVGDAFELRRPDSLSNKHILIVDDIITTGATVTSCGMEIAKASNTRISVMSICKTR